jgi:threonylcarbamoyladenosine tRNA methylthiotransferase MtaB
MNRRWGARRFIDRCRMIRDHLPQPALTTDVIVGFPGETEADFEATCEVVRECGFSKVHIFPFSARRGTPAHDLPGQVDRSTRSKRGRRLARIEGELRERYFRSLVGSTLRVLIESPTADAADWTGTSCRYTPTLVARTVGQPGGFLDVTATAAAADSVRGEAKLMVGSYG